MRRYYFNPRCSSATLCYFCLPRLQVESSSHELCHKAVQHSGKDHFRWLCCVLCQTKEPDRYAIVFGSCLNSCWYFDMISNIFTVNHWLVILCSDIFRRRDQGQSGTATFQYDDVRVTVSCKKLYTLKKTKQFCAVHLILICDFLFLLFQFIQCTMSTWGEMSGKGNRTYSSIYSIYNKSLVAMSFFF